MRDVTGTLVCENLGLIKESKFSYWILYNGKFLSESKFHLLIKAPLTMQDKTCTQFNWAIGMSKFTDLNIMAAKDFWISFVITFKGRLLLTYWLWHRTAWISDFGVLPPCVNIYLNPNRDLNQVWSILPALGLLPSTVGAAARGVANPMQAKWIKLNLIKTISRSFVDKVAWACNT